MAAFTDPDAPEGMSLRFQSAFRRALMSLRADVLACRSTGNAAVVNRLCAMLTPEAVTGGAGWTGGAPCGAGFPAVLF